MTPLRLLKPPRPARKRVHPGTCEVSQTNTISGVVRILHFRDSSKISDELSMAPCVVWRRQSPTEMQFSAGSAKLMKINNPCGAWPQEQLVNLKIQGRNTMRSQHSWVQRQPVNLKIQGRNPMRSQHSWVQRLLVNLKIQGRTRMCSQHWCPVGFDQF